MYTRVEMVHGHGFEDSYAIWEMDDASFTLPFVKPLPTRLVTYTRLNRTPFDSDRQTYYLKPTHNPRASMTFGTYMLEDRKPDDTLIFWSFRVHEWFQSKGIGNFLLDCAVNHARDLNYRQLVLFVDEDNWRAQRLYRRYGFTIEPRANRLQWALRCVYSLR